MPHSFKEIPDTTVDQIMLTNAGWPAFRSQHKDAINTTIGIMIDPESGDPWQPEIVQKARLAALKDINRHHDFGYQTQTGNAAFLEKAGRMVFGERDFTKNFADVMSYQTLGGTGALRLSSDALKASLTVRRDGCLSLVLDGGWPNHPAIFSKPFSLWTYPHLHPSTGLYNHQAALQTIADSSDRVVVLLQAGGYNDDGADRTTKEWDEILSLIEQKQDIVILDSAYLGLANGLLEDRYPILECLKRGILTFVCVSFSKNMGLYNERLGTLFILNAKQHLGAQQAKNLHQLVTRNVRQSVSSTPLLAAQAAATVLSVPEYYIELENARQRLLKNRRVLARAFKDLPAIERGRGLFTKLYPDGFSKDQQDILAQNGILTLPNSRLNLGGISNSQMLRVTKILSQVTSLKTS